MPWASTATCPRSSRWGNRIAGVCGGGAWWLGPFVEAGWKGGQISKYAVGKRRHVPESSIYYVMALCLAGLECPRLSRWGGWLAVTKRIEGWHLQIGG